jgi:hypothetical protein
MRNLRINGYQKQADFIESVCAILPDKREHSDAVLERLIPVVAKIKD